MYGKGKVVMRYANISICCYSFVFAAAGLYYIAELVEEYTSAARKMIIMMISFTMFVYVMFIFCDDLPWSMIIMGFVTQFLHLSIMSSFPFIKFLSLPFIGTVVCLIANHLLAFQFFTSVYYPFTQVRLHYDDKLFIRQSIVTLFFCIADISLFHHLFVDGSLRSFRFLKCKW